MSDYYLITFKNTHSAISGEKFLKEKGFAPVVMPTPTTLTKSCGISLRITPEDFKAVSEYIKAEEMETGNIFFKNEEGYKLWTR